MNNEEMESSWKSKHHQELHNELESLRKENEKMKDCLNSIVTEFETLEKLEYPLKPTDYVMKAKNWAYVISKEALQSVDNGKGDK